MSLRIDLDLVGDLVDELSFPSAHDLGFILIEPLHLELPQDVRQVGLKVVQLDENVLQIEFPLEHLGHFVDL